MVFGNCTHSRLNADDSGPAFELRNRVFIQGVSAIQHVCRCIYVGACMAVETQVAFPITVRCNGSRFAELRRLFARENRHVVMKGMAKICDFHGCKFSKLGCTIFATAFSMHKVIPNVCFSDIIPVKEIAWFWKAFIFVKVFLVK